MTATRFLVEGVVASDGFYRDAETVTVGRPSRAREKGSENERQSEK